MPVCEITTMDSRVIPSLCDARPLDAAGRPERNFELCQRRQQATDYPAMYAAIRAAMAQPQS